MSETIGLSRLKIAMKERSRFMHFEKEKWGSDLFSRELRLNACCCAYPFVWCLPMGSRGHESVSYAMVKLRDGNGCLLIALDWNSLLVEFH